MRRPRRVQYPNLVEALTSGSAKVERRVGPAPTDTADSPAEQAVRALRFGNSSDPHCASVGIGAPGSGEAIPTIFRDVPVDLERRESDSDSRRSSGLLLFVVVVRGEEKVLGEFEGPATSSHSHAIVYIFVLCAVECVEAPWRSGQQSFS